VKLSQSVDVTRTEVGQFGVTSGSQLEALVKGCPTDLPIQVPFPAPPSVTWAKQNQQRRGSFRSKA